MIKVLLLLQQPTTFPSKSQSTSSSATRWLVSLFWCGVFQPLQQKQWLMLDAVSPCATGIPRPQAQLSPLSTWMNFLKLFTSFWMARYLVLVSWYWRVISSGSPCLQMGRKNHMKVSRSYWVLWKDDKKFNNNLACRWRSKINMQVSRSHWALWKDDKKLKRKTCLQVGRKKHMSSLKPGSWEVEFLKVFFYIFNQALWSRCFHSAFTSFCSSFILE